MTQYEVTFKGYAPIKVISVFSNDATSVFSKDDLISIDNRKTIEIQIATDAALPDTLLKIFADDNALSEITITDPTNGNMYVHLNYNIAIKIALEAFDQEDNNREIYGDNRWIMKLAQLTEVDKQMRKLAGKAIKDKSCMTTSEYKDYLIADSKEKLKQYLQNVPMQFKGELFTVTTEKQNQFTNKFIAATTAGIPMTWNASGSFDVERSNEWCQEFIVQTSIYTTSLANKQRTYEEQVKRAITKTELDTLILNF